MVMARIISETSRNFPEPGRYTEIPLIGQLDDYFRIHYRNGGSETQILTPGEVITDPNLEICIIGNRSLRPESLLLRPDDHKIISVDIPATGDVVDIDQPGKSGMILFYKSGSNGRQRLQNAVLEALNRDHKRQDDGHVAKVRQINDAGWRVYWAPLQDRRMLNHVRLVPVDSNGRCIEPTDFECNNLRAVLQSLRQIDS